jgi:hypothetical protein
LPLLLYTGARSFQFFDNTVSCLVLYWLCAVACCCVVFSCCVMPCRPLLYSVVSCRKPSSVILCCLYVRFCMCLCFVLFHLVLSRVVLCSRMLYCLVSVLCCRVVSRYLRFCMCLRVCLLGVGILKNTLSKYINIIRLYYCLELVRIRLRGRTSRDFHRAESPSSPRGNARYGRK